MKLLIAYLTGEERHFTFEHFVSLVSKSSRTAEWKLCVLSHTADLEVYKRAVQGTSIDAEYHFVPLNSENYMNKMRKAVERAKENAIPYLLKCDNDVFFSAETLEYMIDSLDELKKGTHLTLGPTLTTGVPSIEYFLQDYCTKEECAELESIFLQTDMYSIGGVDYTSLNKFTYGADTWEPSAFFESVKAFPHYYKGVHPVRFSGPAQKKIHEILVKRSDVFLPGRSMSLISDTTSPYLCDSCYCVSVDTYDTIIRDRTHFVDDYDEVPLNSYAQKNGLGHLFVRNGFGVHMYYNWITGHRDFEREFCAQFPFTGKAS
jgi:hypothetical protein